MVFTLAGASLLREAPVLETPRLRLRPHRADDLDALHAIWSEPDVYRYIGGEPATRQDVWMRLLRYGGMWPMLGYGFWAVEDKASGALVGDLGYADFQREITPSLDGMLELGWVLAPSVHGRGYASEALAAVLGWGDRYLGAHRAACIISPENAASIRVAEKAGFLPWCDTTFHDAPIRMFTRDVPATAPR
jgi:RimJ/RimL family protein N-acetyltransferase